MMPTVYFRMEFMINGGVFYFHYFTTCIKKHAIEDEAVCMFSGRVIRLFINTVER